MKIARITQDISKPKILKLIYLTCLCPGATHQMTHAVSFTVPPYRARTATEPPSIYFVGLKLGVSVPHVIHNNYIISLC